MSVVVCAKSSRAYPCVCMPKQYPDCPPNPPSEGGLCDGINTGSSNTVVLKRATQPAFGATFGKRGQSCATSHPGSASARAPNVSGAWSKPRTTVTTATGFCKSNR